MPDMYNNNGNASVIQETNDTIIADAIPPEFVQPPFKGNTKFPWIFSMLESIKEELENTPCICLAKAIQRTFRFRRQLNFPCHILA